MSFALASTKHGAVLALQQGQTNNPVPLDRCLLQSHAANTILQRLNDAMCSSRTLQAYDAKSRSGFLKRVVIREGWLTHIAPEMLADVPPEISNTVAHFLVNLVTNGEGTPKQQAALQNVAKLISREQDTGSALVTGVTQSVHVASNMSAPASSVKCLYGQPYAYTSVFGVAYRISPNAFFQVNSEQVHRLFQLIMDEAKLTSDDIVLDLYCGTGAIALQLANKCKNAFGVDIVQSSIIDARINARLNGISNVEFYVADLSGRGEKNARVLAKLDVLAASVIVLDPGRAGLSRTVREFVTHHSHATRIVYISCNSEKLCRDLRELCADGRWRCTTVHPVDMFPQTDHLEVVVVLERHIF